LNHIIFKVGLISIDAQGYFAITMATLSFVFLVLLLASSRFALAECRQRLSRWLKRNRRLGRADLSDKGLQDVGKLRIGHKARHLDEDAAVVEE
jgi:hypothetical protein